MPPVAAGSPARRRKWSRTLFRAIVDIHPRKVSLGCSLRKPFQNLRSTRETELAETYPIHVVCAWIGNSEAVAAKHYLQVTDEHFERAQKVTRNPTHSGAVLSNPAHSGKTQKPAFRGKSEEIPVLVNLPSSPGRTRTYDKPVNSRLLYQLSYRGMGKNIVVHRPESDKCLKQPIGRSSSAELRAAYGAKLLWTARPFNATIARVLSRVGQVSKGARLPLCEAHSGGFC